MKKFYMIIFIALLFIGCKNETKAQVYYLDAFKNYKEQNFDEALKLTDKALLENRHLYQAKFLKAKTLFFKKEYQKAEDLFLNLTETKSENFDCKLWLLRCYIFNGKLTEAQHYTNALILTNTEDWRLYYYNAQIAKQQSNFEDYFSNLNKAESLLKDSSAVYLDLAVIWHEFGLGERSTLYYSKAQTISN